MAGSLKKLSRALAYTATWAADVLTVTTSEAHHLKSGDIIRFALTEVTDEMVNKTVTYVDVDTFTVPAPNYRFKTSAGHVIIDYFSAGMTGDIPVFSIAPSSVNQNGIIQLTAHGAGGAVFVLSVSNDQVS